MPHNMPFTFSCYSWFGIRSEISVFLSSFNFFILLSSFPRLLTQWGWQIYNYFVLQKKKKIYIQLLQDLLDQIRKFSCKVEALFTLFHRSSNFFVFDSISILPINIKHLYRQICVFVDQWLYLIRLMVSPRNTTENIVEKCT